MHDGQKWVQEGKEVTTWKCFPGSANDLDIFNPHEPLFYSQKTLVVGANNSEVSNVASDEDTVQDAEVPSLEQKKNK